MSLDRIQQRLTQVRGIDPASLSRVGLSAAVQRRMQALGLAAVGHYADRLVLDEAEFERLVAAVLVHETSFFRYPASFALLAREGVRRLAADDRAVLRIACVASSTGEEPASAVMALLEAGVAPERIVVDASDVSRRAIDYAVEGHYRRRGVERLAPERVARWFTPEGEGYRLRAAVRERIRTREQDALAPSFGLGAPPYDVVFCRNLLIYLVPEARVKLLQCLIRMLRRDGLLLVGHAEVAAARAMGLATEPPNDAFACRRVVLPEPLPPPARAPTPPPRRRPPEPAPRRRAAPTTPTEDALARASRLADAGELEQAHAVLRDAVAAGPATADHYHLLALVESARGDDDACEAALRRALYVDAHHYPSLMQLALLHDARGERGRAARLREKAARVKGGDDGR